MKKIIVPILACMLTSGIYAQKAVEGVKFTDNWSVGGQCGCNQSAYSQCIF